MSKLVPLLIAPVLALVLLAGCGSDDEEDEVTTSAAVTAEDCTPEKLETLEPGKLTVATDSPAFPPYFVDDDPTNGKGFESASRTRWPSSSGSARPT